MSAYSALVREAPKVASASVGAASEVPSCQPSAGMFMVTLLGGVVVGFVIERYTRKTA